MRTLQWKARQGFKFFVALDASFVDAEAAVAYAQTARRAFGFAPSFRKVRKQLVYEAESRDAGSDAFAGYPRYVRKSFARGLTPQHHTLLRDWPELCESGAVAQFESLATCCVAAELLAIPSLLYSQRTVVYALPSYTACSERAALLKQRFAHVFRTALSFDHAQANALKRHDLLILTYENANYLLDQILLLFPIYRHGAVFAGCETGKASAADRCDLEKRLAAQCLCNFLQSFVLVQAQDVRAERLVHFESIVTKLVALNRLLASHTHKRIPLMFFYSGPVAEFYAARLLLHLPSGAAISKSDARDAPSALPSPAVTPRPAKHSLVFWHYLAFLVQNADASAFLAVDRYWQQLFFEFLRAHSVCMTGANEDGDARTVTLSLPAAFTSHVLQKAETSIASFLRWSESTDASDSPSETEASLRSSQTVDDCSRQRASCAHIAALEGPSVSRSDDASLRSREITIRCFATALNLQQSLNHWAVRSQTRLVAVAAFARTDSEELGELEASSSVFVRLFPTHYSKALRAALAPSAQAPSARLHFDVLYLPSHFWVLCRTALSLLLAAQTSCVDVFSVTQLFAFSTLRPRDLLARVARCINVLEFLGLGSAAMDRRRGLDDFFASQYAKVMKQRATAERGSADLDSSRVAAPQTDELMRCSQLLKTALSHNGADFVSRITAYFNTPLERQLPKTDTAQFHASLVGLAALRGMQSFSNLIPRLFLLTKLVYFGQPNNSTLLYRMLCVDQAFVLRHGFYGTMAAIIASYRCVAPALEQCLAALDLDFDEIRQLASNRALFSKILDIHKNLVSVNLALKPTVLLLYQKCLTVALLAFAILWESVSTLAATSGAPSNRALDLDISRLRLNDEWLSMFHGVCVHEAKSAVLFLKTLGLHDGAAVLSSFVPPQDDSLSAPSAADLLAAKKLQRELQVSNLLLCLDLVKNGFSRPERFLELHKLRQLFDIVLPYTPLSIVSEEFNNCAWELVEHLYARSCKLCNAQPATAKLRTQLDFESDFESLGSEIFEEFED